MLSSVAAAIPGRYTKSAQLTPLPSSGDRTLLMLSHEGYLFQDAPLRKYGLDTFLESLLILSDVLILRRESFQFHLH